MFNREFSRPTLLFCVSAFLCASVASAQTCQSAVNGPYLYSAIGNGVPGGSAPDGAAPFSNTGVGQLVAGATNSMPFTSAGTLYFDGAGGIRATNTAQLGSATTAVGAYALNTDCTITVMLTDAFGTNQTVATLQGVVLGNGSEIDLGMLQTSATDSSSTALAVNQSSLLIRLLRPLATYCNVSNLDGAYVLIAPGTRTTTVDGIGIAPVQSVAPFFMFGTAQFDGNGGIVSPHGPNSSMSSLQFGGSYTIATDCTGTITLTAPSSSTGSTGFSTTGPTLLLNFVLTQSDSSTGARPEIHFSSSTGTQTLFGDGRAQ